MNHHEMRIDQLNFNTEADYDSIQAFSIGHESCILKFFQIIRDHDLLKFIEKEKEAGKQIRIITPFVPEKHLAEIKAVLTEINTMPCFRNSLIIVNDLGLMRYIHRIDETRQMRLGRGFLVCFDYAPWGHRIYETETLKIQKTVSQVSLYDDEKLEFFKQYNVSETEAELTEKTAESLKEIQKAGFRVYVHRSSFLYGIQRSCHIKRHLMDQSCRGTECEYPEQLQLDELWCGDGFYKPLENIDFPSPLYLRGNQIYGSPHEVPYGWADGIIINPGEDPRDQGAGA